MSCSVQNTSTAKAFTIYWKVLINFHTCSVTAELWPVLHRLNMKSNAYEKDILKLYKIVKLKQVCLELYEAMA